MSNEIQDPLIVQHQQEQRAHLNNQVQYPPVYDQPYQLQQQDSQQNENRTNVPSEFRQSMNQPPNDELIPQSNHDIAQIQNIDQWVRIIPCVLLGLAVVIIGSIFLDNCILSQVSIYVTSGAILIILPLAVYFYDIQSKFMNFVASLISFYFMVVLSIYADQQKSVNFNDPYFYQSFCTKVEDLNVKVHDGISYGVICLLGLTMCLFHTVNTVYYFSQVWIHSSHHLKQKAENYTIELI